MGKAFDNFLAQYENMMIDPWRIDEHRGVYKGYLERSPEGKYSQVLRLFGSRVRCAQIRLPEDVADPDELPL